MKVCELQQSKRCSAPSWSLPYPTWTSAATNKSCLLALCKLLAFASFFAITF
ncbi:hypothetical protein SPRG_12541 [Saprolegnia parasitica CBS 223.65]|uniref:Uncharacterized protein n=1 Tax=Saprolegnia parasitica (strain CBS 223.65) TaxID=695850 RepID=A0A067C6X9_SAPPC|nr:hypothetical protein SPRG_12541 [Saprolegnia parasitica CBS 223.65]KDO22562.1 hypothetical protein SPRG_12541 [Saprolegnia parasitica CBS 223.65]|eukprot:XP_012206679.1 hypothetical protein SPRG_12541 [Saprolegnia parasitica CBS 223.65]